MKHKLYKSIPLILIITLILLWNTQGMAQISKSLSLDTCQKLAEQNYPQIKQYDLIQQSTAYSLSNAQKSKLPQISIIGQATYQSDVTSLPEGGPFNAPSISKDQYKIYGEVVQPLTGIGIINQQQKILESKGAIDEADLEVKLYQVKQRVSDIYFGILLIESQLAQSELTKQDVKTGISRLQASVEFGTALKSSLDVLNAELLSLDQRIIEQNSIRDSFREMLSLFIGRDLETTEKLLEPEISISGNDISRPELKLFSSRMENINQQSLLINKRNRPNLSLFVQGGFGRPALNFLSNNFDPYYIGGLRMSWNISNYYSSTQEKQLFALNQQSLQSEQETFLFNTRLAMTQQEGQINKMQSLIMKDQEIIALRESVLKSALGQLENGVITAGEYKTIINDAEKARMNRSLHQIELLKYKNDYKISSGN